MFRYILTLSLLGNALLGWHLLGSRAKPTEENPPSPPSVSILGNLKTQPATQWSRVETSSPEDLATNLRRIGCPEHLIRNAQAATINRSYQKPAQKLQTPAKFWSTADDRNAQKQAYRLALLDLNQARRDDLAATIGTPNAPEKNWPGRKMVFYRALSFGYLSPEAFERVVPIFTHARDQSRELERLPLQGLRREALYAEYDTDMSQVVSAQERFLTETFIFQFQLFDVWNSEQQFGVKLNAEEKQTMMKILMPPDFMKHHFFQLPLESARDDGFRQESENQLREVFGEDVLEHYRKFNQERSLENAVFPSAP